MTFKKRMVAIGLKLMAKALVSTTEIEEEVKKELDYFPDDFIIELKVFRTDTRVALRKIEDGFEYLASDYNLEPDLSVIFKSYEAALLLILGRIGLYEGYSQHRFIVKGDFAKAMPLLRILYYVEAYLFPKPISEKILKEMPETSSSKFKAYTKMFF